MIRITAWAAIVCLCVSGCKESAPAEEAPVAEQRQTTTTTHITPTPSTVRMAGIIADAFNRIDPMQSSYYTTEARQAMLMSQLQNPDMATRINAWAFYAKELLNAGKTEQSIAQFHPLIAEVTKIPGTEEAAKNLNRFLAVAYLRLGEEANCINQRNAESCIIPISPQAQFTMTQGSETAMRICTEILQRYGDDEETVWILNLAAMTIGKYPDGVPARWRLPEAHFDSGKSFPRFMDVSQRVGIRGQRLSGGVCVEDFDGDGWLDIITSAWGKNDPLLFWKNSGNGRFENASAQMGLQGIHGGLNMIHGDVNNDGLADLFVLRGAWLFGQGKIPNSLLINQGNGRFTDETEAAGLLTFAPTQTAVFADFNLDGWLDLFVGNETTDAGAFQNEFYLNNGNGTFRNVIHATGIRAQAMIKACVAGDINNDGWPDLYLSNYIGQNFLFLNKGPDANGIPQFEDITVRAGVGEPRNSFPAWFWDFDNDGWEDIFVSGYGDGSLAVARDYVRNARGQYDKSHPRIYRNKGNNTFTDVSASMGIKESVFTMGCNYGDLDADGYLDFYLGTGNPEFSSTVPNKMYYNNKGKSFDDITAAGGFGQIQKGHAVGFGDLDGDGDEDFFQSLGGAFDADVFEDVLYENPIGQDRSWVVLRLQGVKANRMAVGARVRVSVSTPSGKRQIHRTVSTGGSFGSSSLQLEIGLDNATAIDEIRIIWPVRVQTTQVLRNVQLNRYIHITEGGELTYLDIEPVRF